MLALGSVPVRNGLMIVILALSQIRLKNFVALEIGSTYKEVNGSWWISVPAGSTKNKRWIEKRIPNSFNHAIKLYLAQARPILMKSSGVHNSLWISSRTGRRLAVGHSDKLAAFVLSARRLVATEISCFRVRLAYVGS